MKLEVCVLSEWGRDKQGTSQQGRHATWNVRANHTTTRLGDNGRFRGQHHSLLSTLISRRLSMDIRPVSRSSGRDRGTPIPRPLGTCRRSPSCPRARYGRVTSPTHPETAAYRADGMPKRASGQAARTRRRPMQIPSTGKVALATILHASFGCLIGSSSRTLSWRPLDSSPRLVKWSTAPRRRQSRSRFLKR